MSDPEGITSRQDESFRFRARLLAACVVLIGLALAQSPGFLVADTKFDLAVDPGGFLSRALHLWDPLAALGQLQNQSYGYLWPMGPFFLLGSVMDIPGWVVQRLWLALVLCVGFTGTAKLSRVLGVRSDLACILAGVAFALSPRMLTTLGPISIEAWPSALAPWVLLPLVLGSRGGSARRAAAWSALAVAMVGGVNAAATFAVIPLGVVWLLTRTAGPRRRTMMLWWPVFTFLGTMWWLIPLFVLGAYSPPFLDYIETTAVTTFPTTVFDTIRGTSNWVPYVDAGSRAGNDLVTVSYLAFNSGLVLLLGFVGLLDRRTPERRFLILGLLVGILMVTAGHHGVVAGWWHSEIADLLDGVLAPLRNVHKFDVIVRLPLVLGLAFAVDRLTSRSAVGALRRVNKVVLIGVAVMVVVAAAMPAVLGRVAPARPVLTVPDYWAQTASWLGDNAGEDQAALLVPGTSFGDYLWGSPHDEPMQWLAETPWAVRNAIPLAPTGNIRMLDRIERAFAQGAGSAGLAGSLRRAGVGYVVVRNDLQDDEDRPDTALVHQAIAQSPGLRMVASFGPEVGSGASFEAGDGTRVLVNGGWQTNRKAVEIYEVPGRTGPVVAANAPVVVGGPEDLLDLENLGVLQDQPTVLAADLDGPPAPGTKVVLTDGLREREQFFARVHDGASASITPGDVRRNDNPRVDYLLEDHARWSSTVRLSGAASLSASSSGSDSNALGGVEAGELPFAAVDGSAETAWVSGPAVEGPAWWQIDLGRRPDLRAATIVTDDHTSGSQRVRVVTEQGASEVISLPVDDVTRVDLGEAAGATDWLRVEDASATGGRELRLAEVRIASTEVRRAVALPALPDGWPTPEAIVLRADLDARTGCVEIGTDVRCVSGRGRTSEEPHGMARDFSLPRATSYPVRMQMIPVAGASLDRLILREQAVDLSASSTATNDPRAGAVAAVDGDPGTTWLADPSELLPTLWLNLLERETIRGMRISTDRRDAARAPTKVAVRWPGGTFEAKVIDGYVRFPRAIRTKQVRVQVLEASLLHSTDPVEGGVAVGVGISELRLVGVPYLPVGLSADPKDLGCGSGPRVEVNGQTYPTALTASPLELFRRASVPAVLCAGDERVEQVALPAGTSSVTVLPHDSLQVSSVVFGAGADSVDVGAAPATTAGPTKRTYAVTGDETVLDTRHNVNAGWNATSGGTELEPITLDGWKQGWRLSGPGEVRASFGPDRTYRAGLLAGMIALLGLVAIAVLTGRRTRRAHPPALTERPLGPLVGFSATFLALGLVAGFAGVLLGAVAGAVAMLARRRYGDTTALVASVACLVVGAVYMLRPWASADGWAGALDWAQYLTLIPIAVLFASAIDRSGQRRSGIARRIRIDLRRSAGRSTNR